MLRLNRYKRLFIIALFSLSILSCGGSSIISAGISGTGIVLGVITGFGSIYVNGVEYDVAGASFDINDNTSADDSALQVGMVVRLLATNNGDGTGTATQVVYDELITGPVASTPISPVNGDTGQKSLQILGKTVIIDSTSTSYGAGVGFDTIAVNDVLEVSGFVDSDMIYATRVELKGVLTPNATEVEIHGQVSNLDSPIALSFDLAGISVDYSSATLEDLASGLSDGQYVEVKGVFINSTSIQASVIEGEDDNDQQVIEGATGEVSLQGYITSFTNTSEFKVNGISVNLDTASISTMVLNALGTGVEVEVNGVIDSGILMADSIKIRQGDFEFEAELKSVSVPDSSLGIGFPGISGEITLKVDSLSQMVSDLSGLSLTLDDLTSMIDQEVRIKARISAGTLYITTLKRKAITGYEIESTLSAINQGSDVTVFGLTVPLEGSAATTDLSVFILNETMVELEDKDKNGKFESIEIED